MLCGPLFCHSLLFTSLPVSTWFSIGSIGFWIWPRYIVTRTHRLYIYNLITDYIIYVYMRYICLCIHTHIRVYIYIYIYIYVCVCVCVYVCAVIPHTALLSHSKLPQGKFLNRDSPTAEVFSIMIIINVSWVANKHIRIISEGSCNTKDWSNGCWKNSKEKRSFFYIIIIFNNIKMFTVFLNQINAALLSVKDWPVEQ